MSHLDGKSIVVRVKRDRETHTLYILQSATVEEMAALFEEMPKDEVIKLRNAVLRVVAIRSLEKALGDGRDR